MEEILWGKNFESEGDEHEQLLKCFIHLYNCDLEYFERVFKFDLSRVFVAPSPIHGMGVFAAFDIPAYEIVTLFPASKGFGRYRDGAVSRVLYYDPINSGVEANPRYRAVVRMSGDSKYYIEADPYAPRKPGWVGHLINDACTMSATTAKAIKKYQQASEKQSNVGLLQFQSGLMAIMTKREIKEGEELLLNYGPMFYSLTNDIKISEKQDAKEYKEYLKKLKLAIIQGFGNMEKLEQKMKEKNKNAYVALNNYTVFLKMAKKQVEDKKAAEIEEKRGVKAGMKFGHYKSNLS